MLLRRRQERKGISSLSLPHGDKSVLDLNTKNAVIEVVFLLFVRRGRPRVNLYESCLEMGLSIRSPHHQDIQQFAWVFLPHAAPDNSQKGHLGGPKNPMVHFVQESLTAMTTRETSMSC
jgi:hypothetical protein